MKKSHDPLIFIRGIENEIHLVHSLSLKKNLEEKPFTK